VLLSLFIGVLIGAVLGLTGAGGSVVAVPLLMAGSGYGFTTAAGASLGAVAAAALLGVVLRWQQKEVVWVLAAILACGGVVVSPLGQMLAHHLPEWVLTASFALLMAVMAWRLWQQAQQHPEEAKIVRAALEHSETRSPICMTSETKPSWQCFQKMLPVGAVTGLLTGLYGVGGGFIIVPMLVLWAGLPLSQAVATSLAVISVVAGSTFILFLATAALPAGFLMVMPGALLGMLVGTLVAKRLAGAQLQKGLSILMVLLAVQVLFRTFF
jgi:hypothetical protein